MNSFNKTVSWNMSRKTSSQVPVHTHSPCTFLNMETFQTFPERVGPGAGITQLWQVNLEYPFSLSIFRDMSPREKLVEWEVFPSRVQSLATPVLLTCSSAVEKGSLDCSMSFSVGLSLPPFWPGLSSCQPAVILQHVSHPRPHRLRTTQREL